MRWILALMDNIRNWWYNHRTDVELAVLDFWEGFDRISHNITRFMVIGVILNIVVSKLYPEFSQRFPVIYGWFDGWLQLGEFVLKGALGGIYSFFTGNFNEFWTKYDLAFQELLHQFSSWLSTLSF